jgi:hypothetical protein
MYTEKYIYINTNYIIYIMNSKRIIDDLDFVEENRNINMRRDMNDEEHFKLRKLYTIYLTIHDIYCIYNSIECDFNNLEKVYIQYYNNNAITMINNINIDTILIHNYAYHVESLKLLQKLSYEKSLKESHVITPELPTHNLLLYGVCFSIVNLFCLNIIIARNIYKNL